MAPYISIVVTGRNDNHGGDMTRRMRMFMTGLMHQCNSYRLPMELVFVEWNPPLDKPLLKEVLPTPAQGDYLTLRYIVVPPELHLNLKNNDRIHLHQMIAKNVGIRRAKGEFVLSTNLDILFSDEIVKFFSKRKLDKNRFYRTNRCDIPETIDESLSHEKRLEFCKKNVLKRWGLNPNFQHNVGFPGIFNIFIIHHFTRLFNKLLRKYFFPLNSPTTGNDYFASGDFTLMSKDAWDRIDGYMELDIFPLHIDSLALDAALAIGLKQQVLPKEQCVYHIHHHEGWVTLDPLAALHYTIKRPVLDWSVANNASNYIVTNKLKFGVNKSNWGYSDSSFEEFVFNEKQS